MGRTYQVCCHRLVVAGLALHAVTIWVMILKKTACSWKLWIITSYYHNVNSWSGAFNGKVENTQIELATNVMITCLLKTFFRYVSIGLCCTILLRSENAVGSYNNQGGPRYEIWYLVQWVQGNELAGHESNVYTPFSYDFHRLIHSFMFSYCSHIHWMLHWHIYILC